MEYDKLVTMISELVIKELLLEKKNVIPVALSNRHAHLSQKDIDLLFGKGYKLTVEKELSQPGQFAAKETVDLVGPKRVLKGVRLLGPPRKESQVELSLTDGFILGINPPVRPSGNIDNTPGISIIGPKGAVVLERGVIGASRHIHMTPQDALKFDLKDGDIVKVKISGIRKTIFDDVTVRVNNEFSTELHLDIDEGNAALVKNGDMAEIIT